MAFIAPLIGVASSIYSTAHAASQRKKAERELEKMKTPEYTANPSILDYYQKALQKYNTNPTDTAQYKLNQQNIKQGTTQAIAAGQDRRLGGAIVPAIIQGQNNSLLKAAAMGEQQKNADLSRLGQAAGMRSGEEAKAFQMNKVYPFEKQYNLIAQKAAGQAQVQNQSMTNLYNNIGALASMIPENLNKETFKDQYGKAGQWRQAYKWANKRGMDFNDYNTMFNKNISTLGSIL